MNENFEYSLVANHITTLDNSVVAARNALTKGTAQITSSLGTDGDALRGGAAQDLLGKWQELEGVFYRFYNYIEDTIVNARRVGKNNEELELAARASIANESKNA